MELPDTINALWRRAAEALGPRPLVTDLRNDGRTELGGVAFAQWVQKVANAFEDELPPQPRVHIDLPPSWLWPVLVAAVAEIDGTLCESDADAIVSETPQPGSPALVYLVRVHPLALPLEVPPPAGHLDFFREMRGGADFRPATAGRADRVYLTDASGEHTEAQVIAGRPDVPAAPRILVRRDDLPASTMSLVGRLALAPWAARLPLVIADAASDVTGEGRLAEYA